MTAYGVRLSVRVALALVFTSCYATQSMHGEFALDMLRKGRDTFDADARIWRDANTTLVCGFASCDYGEHLVGVMLMKYRNGSVVLALWAESGLLTMEMDAEEVDELCRCISRQMDGHANAAKPKSFVVFVTPSGKVGMWSLEDATRLPHSRSDMWGRILRFLRYWYP